MTTNNAENVPNEYEISFIELNNLCRKVLSDIIKTEQIVDVASVLSKIELVLKCEDSWWFKKHTESYIWLYILLIITIEFLQLNEMFYYKIDDICKNSIIGIQPAGFDSIIESFFQENKKRHAILKQIIEDSEYTPLDKSFIAYLICKSNCATEILAVLDRYDEKTSGVMARNWEPKWYCYLLSKIQNLNGLQEKVERLFANAYRYYAKLNLLAVLQKQKSIKQHSEELFFQQRAGQLLLADADRNGYPPLDVNLLRDPLRGHWDLWPNDGANLGQAKQVIALEDGLMARNPAGDIQKRVPVCIDFGTSSTVVALRENGRRRLLRVGVSDWKEAVIPAHFENPTALEFINAADIVKAWAEEEWRPHVRWVSLKCSHQAKNDISPVAKPETLFSIIGDLKTWARSTAHQPPLDMRDQQGATLRLSADAAGDGSVENGAPFILNPLELYAFHLGLAINNQYRDNGRIYHEYYLSFPATFDSATRQRILSGFARGLERSLPASLGQQQEWREQTPFAVLEGADEPVAYAAAVLGERGLEPTDAGLAFGVFDFGGGTTDFAFGLYRWATQEEERRTGWESVLQLLDVAGDADLGGEVLLHMLAFAVICGNSEMVLAKDVPFVLPRTAKSVPTGMELVFGDSLIARANTTRLMEALRPLWEQGHDAFDSENEGLLRLNMQDRDGKGECLIEFRVDKDELTTLLHDRILAGVAAFFVSFQQAFKRHNAQAQETLHILLAGNACRSPMVKTCFEEHMQAIAQRENFSSEHFQLHDIRLPDDATPEAVTLKTGVALGLLNTVPGESVGICTVPELTNPDRVFRYAFGTFRRGRLVPALTRFSAPEEWQPLGVVREDLRLIAAYTDSPLALEGGMTRGDAACAELVIDWQAGDAGHEVFVRPSGPDAVEVVLDVTAEQPQGRGSRLFSLKESGK